MRCLLRSAISQILRTPSKQASAVSGLQLFRSAVCFTYDYIMHKQYEYENSVILLTVILALYSCTDEGIVQELSPPDDPTREL